MQVVLLGGDLEGLSYDSVNRFLLRERYELKDFIDELKPHILLVGVVLLSGTIPLLTTFKPDSNRIGWVLGRESITHCQRASG